VSTLTTIVAVGAASTKETSYDYTHRPYTRPASIVCAPGGMNLTNELAKLSLQVGRPGGVGGAAGPQDRHTAGGEEGESSHSAGGAGGQRGQCGRGGRRRRRQSLLP
jgi:hypothetical protein